MKRFTRFSLRFFCIALLMLSIPLAWFAIRAREHRIEQAFVAKHDLVSATFFVT